ncbi:MAG: MFS transporter [Thermoanaerobaculia bacterium]
MKDHAAAHTVGFRELLTGNTNYRRIWLGEVASWFGDWFNAIALYTLVRELTGSPLALGLVFLTKMVPFAVASPLAGLLVDRFNRRRLMIAADLLRALVVLGFLLVHEASDLYLIYALTGVQVILTAVFIPARSASIPNVTTAGELLTANALSAATWSTLLAVGAALGGVATEWFGVRVVFVLDSLSYLVSAAFLWRTSIPQQGDPGASVGSVKSVLGGIAKGWRYLWQHQEVGRMALAKSTWSLGGGALVYMLALLGEDLMPGSPALGIGLLYGLRGLGTGIGPIAVRSWLPDEKRWPLMMGVGIVISGLCYVGVSVVPWLVGIGLLVVLAHAPSGANWVASTVLLQKRTADSFRGRVFSAEWLAVTLADSISILTASLLLESGSVSLSTGVLVFAVVQILCGTLWAVLVVPAERRAEPADS